MTPFSDDILIYSPPPVRVTLCVAAIPLLKDEDPQVVNSVKRYLKEWEERLENCTFPEYSFSLYRARHALTNADL